MYQEDAPTKIRPDDQDSEILLPESSKTFRAALKNWMDAWQETVAADCSDEENDEVGNKKEADANEIRRHACMPRLLADRDLARHLTANFRWKISVNCVEGGCVS
jgi:hypothetical protein